MSASPEVVLEPTVLEWARNRAGLSELDLAQKARIALDRVLEWEQDGHITLKEAERLAKATFTPAGSLYLSVPPDERLTVTDFRVVGEEAPQRPSPDLLDVLDDAVLRQDWYREYLLVNGFDALDFIGSLSENETVLDAAARVRERHGLTAQRRQDARTWEDALRLETEQLEQAGILVMRSGIVGSNTHRALNVHEFRGFAMADAYAPLIFINGVDARAAQIFTLMHELVHLWLGKSGVSNLDRTMPVNNRTERFCNAVAAEVLVPADLLRQRWPDVAGQTDAMTILSRQFKVSGLVVLRRLHDIGVLDWATFRAQYIAEEGRYQEASGRESGGGDFYKTQRVRLSSRFISAVVEATLEGRTSGREAFPLLGIKKVSTFLETARRQGFTV